VQPDGRRPSCQHRAICPTSQMPSGSSSSRCCRLPKSVAVPQVAGEARGGRNLLPTEERKLVADASTGLPVVADRLFPLPQMEARRTAQKGAQPAAYGTEREAEERYCDPSAAVIRVCNTRSKWASVGGRPLARTHPIGHIRRHKAFWRRSTRSSSEPSPCR
jgi:hypothetical protein